MVPLSMKLIDPWPGFQGQDIFPHWISQKRHDIGTIYYRTSIGSHMRSAAVCQPPRRWQLWHRCWRRLLWSHMHLRTTGRCLTCLSCRCWSRESQLSSLVTIWRPMDFYILLFTLDALALSVIATATWLAWWRAAGRLSVTASIVPKRLNLS